MVITCTIIGLYYNVIIAWSLYYFFASMTSQLPWEYCGNWWNTDYCYHFDDLKNITGWFLRRADVRHPSSYTVCLL